LREWVFRPAEASAGGLTPAPPAPDVRAGTWTLHPRRLLDDARQSDPIQHLSDQKMRLGRRQVLAYDLVVEDEAKHRAGVARRFSFDYDPFH
jgi:hypothetical protein